MATQQRSRIAILAGAKKVIAESGNYESNMLDIAARAQVSRATVYNHFADKEEMMAALLESEIERLHQIALNSVSKEAVLFALSREISSDPALATMVRTDPTDIAKFVTLGIHPLWSKVAQGLHEVFGAIAAPMVLRWLLGQVASPLSESESRKQAAILAYAINSDAGK
jgi:AcrR family transcriptional regulator